MRIFIIIDLSITLLRPFPASDKCLQIVISIPEEITSFLQQLQSLIFNPAGKAGRQDQ